MSKFLLGLVIVAFAFHAYQRVHEPAPTPARVEGAEEATDAHLVEQPQAEASSDAPEFRCDGRVHCSQMKSCDEADFFVRNCPGVKMDGDRDGKPCEDRCGH
jgi:hypothetical protein